MTKKQTKTQAEPRKKRDDEAKTKKPFFQAKKTRPQSPLKGLTERTNLPPLFYPFEIKQDP